MPTTQALSREPTSLSGEAQPAAAEVGDNYATCCVAWRIPARRGRSPPVNSLRSPSPRGSPAERPSTSASTRATPLVLGNNASSCKGVSSPRLARSTTETRAGHGNHGEGPSPDLRGRECVSLRGGPHVSSATIVQAGLQALTASRPSRRRTATLRHKGGRSGRTSPESTVGLYVAPPSELQSEQRTNEAAKTRMLMSHRTHSVSCPVRNTGRYY